MENGGILKLIQIRFPETQMQHGGSYHFVPNTVQADIIKVKQAGADPGGCNGTLAPPKASGARRTPPGR